jgi:acetyl-CoA carboxylase carboxyltransferase component
MDTPGFVVGLDAERRGAPGHIMNFMNATSLTTVPQITVICRKAYGRAYVAMGGGVQNDAMVAWPTAEVSFMDPVFATSIVKNLTAGQEGFEDALAEIQKDLEVWDMARIFSAHDVIKPQETRAYLIRMLDIQQRRRSKGLGQHLMRTWPTSY